MKAFWLLSALLLAPPCHAYTVAELLEDCQAAETIRPEAQANTPPSSARGARCTGYLMGIADGYAIADYLATKGGMQINAFCLPRDPDLIHRLTRAVIIQLERMPSNSTSSTASAVASAFAKTFPCADGLEQKR